MLVDILRKLPTEFETARTRNRMMTCDDAEQMLKIWSDNDVTRFMNIETFTTIDQAREIILAIQQEKTANRYVIIDKISDKLIGSFGINELCLDTMSAEIGYELKKSHWELGIMSEVLQVFIQEILSENRILKFTAKVDPENLASIKLLEKLGFNCNKMVSEFDMHTKTLKKCKTIQSRNNLTELALHTTYFVLFLMILMFFCYLLMYNRRKCTCFAMFFTITLKQT